MEKNEKIDTVGGEAERERQKSKAVASHVLNSKALSLSSGKHADIEEV